LTYGSLRKETGSTALALNTNAMKVKIEKQQGDATYKMHKTKQETTSLVHATS